MEKHMLRLALFILLLLAAACASAPEVRYAVEAERVTTQALEPVMLESSELENDIAARFRAYLPDSGTSDDLIKVIQTELANTKRFTKVLLNSSEGDSYIIQPRIDKIDASLKDIPNDPTRKRFNVKARVRLDVLFINQKNQKELVKSFYDERSYDERISVKTKLTNEAKQEYYLRTINVAFRSAADQLGNGFNPSYEMGTLSKLNGRTAHVQINTSRLIKMPKKQQAVEVVDNDNRVLATIAELIVEDGNITGKLFEKSGVTVREGAKVRARINALSD
jgi:hypothetical protein